MRKISNSTYGIHYDFSFVGEEFYSVSSSWRLGSRPILKIRVANWKPKQNRSNQALFYYEVKTKEEALKIINEHESFDFKKYEEMFEKEWTKTGSSITGENNKWWNEYFIPLVKSTC